MDIKEFISSFSLKRNENEIQIDEGASDMGNQTSVKIVKPIVNENTEFNGSFLTSDLMVKGSISSKFDLCISGIVDGDIECEGDVSIFGTVNGNISAQNIVMNQAQIVGNIKAAVNFIQKAGSTVTGDIDANCVDINGIINGNINATGSATFDSLAQVTGNITAGSISVKEDAVINGFMHINKEKKNDTE